MSSSNPRTSRQNHTKSRRGEEVPDEVPHSKENLGALFDLCVTSLLVVDAELISSFALMQSLVLD